MFKKSILAVMFTAALVMAASSAGALNLNDGEWEITSKVEMPGMPMQMPPVTVTQCITADDPVPPQPEAGVPCSAMDVEVNGDTVTWTMECEQDGDTMISTGEITYHGDTFQGVIENQIQGGGETMNVTTRLTGKRLGPCE